MSSQPFDRPARSRRQCTLKADGVDTQCNGDDEMVKSSRPVVSRERRVLKTMTNVMKADSTTGNETSSTSSTTSQECGKAEPGFDDEESDDDLMIPVFEVPKPSMVIKKNVKPSQALLDIRKITNQQRMYSEFDSKYKAASEVTSEVMKPRAVREKNQVQANVVHLSLFTFIPSLTSSPMVTTRSYFRVADTVDQQVDNFLLLSTLRSEIDASALLAKIKSGVSLPLDKVCFVLTEVLAMNGFNYKYLEWITDAALLPLPQVFVPKDKIFSRLAFVFEGLSSVYSEDLFDDVKLSKAIALTLILLREQETETSIQWYDAVVDLLEALMASAPVNSAGLLTVIEKIAACVCRQLDVPNIVKLVEALPDQFDDIRLAIICESLPCVSFNYNFTDWDNLTAVLSYMELLSERPNHLMSTDTEHFYKLNLIHRMADILTVHKNKTWACKEVAKRYDVLKTLHHEGALNFNPFICHLSKILGYYHDKFVMKVEYRGERVDEKVNSIRALYNFN